MLRIIEIKFLKKNFNHFRVLSSISSLKVPEDVDFFPAKMYFWFPESENLKIDILQGLEYTITQSCAEW